MIAAREAFVLVGPTAAGKSTVAHLLAKELHAAILCADSMTVYRGMDVGTAKPSLEERREVPYSGLDLVTPDREFSVADFLDMARSALAGASRWIIVGGSGLYVRCLMEGLRETAPANLGLRARAEKIISEGGVALLRAAVEREAPEHFRVLVDTLNPRRLIRAWEVAAAGLPPGIPGDRNRAVIAGITREAGVLRARIRKRIEDMYGGGLAREVERLRAAYTVWSKTASQAIGYAEALTLLAGRCTVEQAMAETERRTRQLAKRQLTWFRHQASVEWVTADDHEPAEASALKIQRIWETHGATPLHF